MGNEEHKISHLQTSRFLHRFLWTWIGLVYVWGCLHLFVPDPSIFKCWYNSVIPERCPPLQFLPTQVHAWQIVALTLLTSLYGILLWAGLTRKIPQSWHIPSFLAQASCVFAISLVVRQDNVVLSLYLVLTLEAIEMLQNTRLALLVANGSLLCFVFNELLSRGVLQNWITALLGIWISTDYAALSFFLVGYLLLYFQASRIHTQLIAAHMELEEAHQGLSAASRQIAALTRLAERQRLARELHDTLSQGLVGLKLQLEAIDAFLVQRRFDQAQEVVRHAMSHIQQTMGEARGAIDDLRNRQAAPPTGKKGALEEVIQRFTMATGIPCQTHLAALEALPESFYEPLQRVIGEGLSNIARHAQARQVWITASRTNERVHLELRDDGMGFDPVSAAKLSGHYGLLGLRERARLLDGDLKIQSVPGEGTCVCLAFPLHPNSGTPSQTEAARGDT